MMIVLVEDGRFFVRASRLSKGMTFHRFADAEMARVFPGLPLVATTRPVRPEPPTREANETVPTAADLNRIRTGLLAAAGTQDAKIVLFARFADHMSASAIRFRRDHEAGVHPAQFPIETDPNLTEIWNAARARMGDDVWREMIIVLAHGEIRVSLRQPSNPDFHAGFSEAATEVEHAELPN